MYIVSSDELEQGILSWYMNIKEKKKKNQYSPFEFAAFWIRNRQQFLCGGKKMSLFLQEDAVLIQNVA